MSIEHYYYIYSAMTQAMGALIAIIGVFIVFRLQIQRQRIGNTYSVLREQFWSLREFPPKEEIEKKVKNFLQDDNNKRTPKYVIIKRDFDSLKRHKENLQYIINKGKKCIMLVGVVFVYYILILHLNSFLYNLECRIGVSCRIGAFILGITLSIFAVIFSICYVVKCIEFE